MAKKPAVVIPDAYRQALLAAQEETEALRAADPTRSIADPTLPVFQFVARNDLLMEKARYEAGDKNALLGAIRICANHDLVMPEWLARAFIRGYDKVLNHKVGSWDDAFGRPLPKGKHLNAARKKREKGPAAWLEVQRMVKEEDRAIDDLLFEDVGKKLGLGKTLVSEFYYEHEARWSGLSPAAQVLLEQYRKDDPPGVPEKRKTSRKESKKG